LAGGAAEVLASQGEALQGWKGQPNSYPEYLGQRSCEWIHPEEVLYYFSNKYPSLSYESFIREQDSLEILPSFALED